jgi:tellurite resistance protein TehA-like permease
MKWWKKALIASLVWFVLVFGVGILHTEAIRAGELTPAQAAAIMERYGNAVGVGQVAIWIVLFLRRMPPAS